MQKGNFDKMSVFSPEGHLFQVEYAFKAVKLSGATTIAIRGTDSVVIVTQRKLPDRLMKAETVSTMFKLDAQLGACLTGRAPDARYVVNYFREIAAEFKYDNGHHIPIGLLAKRGASRAQIRTQEAGYRSMGVATIIVGMDRDDESGEQKPTIYKVDPAGHYAGYHAAAAGMKEVEAQAELEKLVQKGEPLTGTPVVATEALRVLQKVLRVTLTAKDVEICCVSTQNPVFHTLDINDVEKYLENIATAD